MERSLTLNLFKAYLDCFQASIFLSTILNFSKLFTLLYSFKIDFGVRFKKIFKYQRKKFDYPNDMCMNF